jgi:hypothetical protein
MPTLHHIFAFIFAVVTLVAAAPAGSATYTPSSTATSATATPTVSPASNDANTPLWGPYSNIRPEPIRGKLGASILGPQNIPVELQNSDLFAPPTTDNGAVQNAKWYLISNSAVATLWANVHSVGLLL